MSERFVPLAAYLRPKPPEISPSPLVAEPAAVPDDVAEALSAARRFRAGLADALDAALQRLLEKIAQSVIGRELKIAPVDVAAIAAEAMALHEEERVLAIRAHREDRETLEQFGLPVVADGALCRGDVIVELRSGTIDLRLRSRVAAALAACTT